MTDVPVSRVHVVPTVGDSMVTWAGDYVMLLAALDSRRIQLLQSMIFQRLFDTNSERVECAGYRKTLESLSAHYICVIVWKESDYFPRTAMPAGMEKIFKGQSITQHGLGVAISDSPSKLVLRIHWCGRYQ